MSDNPPGARPMGISHVVMVIRVGRGKQHWRSVTMSEKLGRAMVGL